MLAALRRRKPKRRSRQPRLLGGPPTPDARLPHTSVDPNARFIGDQMGQG
jgi:hypothetical protein